MCYRGKKSIELTNVFCWTVFMNFCHHQCMEFVPNYFLLGFWVFFVIFLGFFRYDTLLIYVPLALFISVE